MNYTYILKCSDGSFYTGWTNDIEKRVIAHNAGTGAKYTKGRLPVSLVYFETFQSKQEAMKCEWKIKHMTRFEKQKLIESKINLIID
jgi:putative endonuclease